MTISPYMYMRLYIGRPPCTRCGMREREREDRGGRERVKGRGRERDRQTDGQTESRQRADGRGSMNGMSHWRKCLFCYDDDDSCC
jgi:hypothetical protein